MKTLLAILTAFFILGCTSDEDRSVPSTTTEPIEKATPPKPTAPAKPEPTPVQPASAPEPPQASAPVQAESHGALLYKSKCASCHGQYAEKSALNASEVIARWNAQRIVDALQGYKAGTYGGSMKGMMQGQVKNLSDDEIVALAEYIGPK